MRATIVLALGAVALAGCQREAQEAKAPSAENPPASLGLRKAGLWTQTVSADGTSQEMKMCLDEASLEDAQISAQQVGREMCSKHAVTPRPGGWSFESVCDTGEGGVITSAGTAQGDGEGYRMEITATTTGAAMPQANGTRKMTLTAKWVGPCPEGMNPGDIQVGGMTIRAQDTMKGAQGR